MIDIEILRRRAKRGISFPKQTPQFVELFGVRCLANCCYELPFTGQVDLGTELFPKGFYV